MDKKITITLAEPFTSMAGLTFNELTADFSLIKTRDIAAINRLERKLKGGDEFSIGSVTKAASPEFRAAFTWIACIKGTKGLTLDDVDNLSMVDYLELSTISLPFVTKMNSSES